MSEGKIGCHSSEERKKKESHPARSQDGAQCVVSNNSFLQELLLELGLTDTAKVLGEEAERKLQSFSDTSMKQTSVNNNDVLSSNRAGSKLNDKTNVVINSCGNTSGGGGGNGNGNGNPSLSREGAKERREGTEQSHDSLPMNMTRMALFRALAYQKEGSDTEMVNTGVLTDLCRIGMSPLRWTSNDLSSIVDDNNGELSLMPLLRKLLRVFLENDNRIWSESFDKKGEELVAIPSEWSPVIEIFFAYVEVLWSQLRLVEAVMSADLETCGWSRRRHSILSRFSQLQEKLQRLLLEAHQLEQTPSNHEPTVSHHDSANTTRPIVSSWNGNKPLSQHSSTSDAMELSSFEMKKGAFFLFGLSAPSYRGNMEEVFLWIMRQLSFSEIGGSTEGPLHLNKTESTLFAESDITANAEDPVKKKENSSRGLWQLLMCIVRRTALAGTDEPPKQHDENDPPPLVGFGFRWAQVMLRIELLSWAIGSVAELADVVLHHLQSAQEEEKNKSRGPSHAKCGEVKPVMSTVSAALGFWYQSCAAILVEGMSNAADTEIEIDSCHQPQLNANGDDNHVDNHSNGNVSDDKKRTSGSYCHRSCRSLPRPRHEEDAVEQEQEERIAHSLLNVLKKATYELFVCTPMAVRPFHFPLVKSELLFDKMLGPSRIGETCEASQLHGERKSDSSFRMFILGALATGKPYQIGQVRGRKSVTLYRLLKRAFRTSRTLLDLQDHRLSVDMQLKAMEQMAVRTSLPKKPVGKGGALKGSPNRRRSERIHPTWFMNEPIAVRTRERGISSVRETPSTAMPEQQEEQEQEDLGTTEIGIDVTTGLERQEEAVEEEEEEEEEVMVENEEVVEVEETGEPFLPAQFQRLMRRMVRTVSETMQVEETNTLDSNDDVDDAASLTDNYDRLMEELPSEVQVVAVTPCGSLLAILMTTGRLVVFTMRSATAGTNQGAVSELQSNSFCEQLVLDTLISRNKKGQEVRWYEQMASFLSFSPCGRFLLCSVQNAPFPVSGGDEGSYRHRESTGRVFIYSLHCVEGGSNEGVANGISNGNDRLYAAFQVHKSPIIVARWLDPRFWQEKGSASGPSPDEGVSRWRRAAHQHLSSLQCLSSALDNLILRWSPANGTIIQRIVTVPLNDILFSPLMQAFYTINQYGELSMYDAWNEHDMESAMENVVEVSQRGLPSSLSVIQPSIEAVKESSSNKNTPLKDGEVQKDFFLGARIIRFDRRYMSQGEMNREPMIARMSRVVREKGALAGAETKEGNRLGRQILYQVLRQEEEHFTTQTQAILESSSASDDGIDGNGLERSQHPTHSCVHTDDPMNPLSLLRSHFSHHKHDKMPAYFRGKKDVSLDGNAIFYKTGSRLVFEGVSQALCHTASIWPAAKDPSYATPPQPYHLLSMAASGHPVFSSDDTDRLCTHRRCQAYEHTETPSATSPLCIYYSDMSRKQSGGKHTAECDDVNTKNRSFQGKGDTLRSLCDSCTCQRKRNHALLEPVAKNGRYLCIVASIGPDRAVVQYDRALEYHPGIYACIVFDVLYGSVVRVIPVCSSIPNAALAQKGFDVSQSHIKKNPTYMLPCSVTVVHQHRQQRRGSGGRRSRKGGWQHFLPQASAEGKMEKMRMSTTIGSHSLFQEELWDDDDEWGSEEEEEWEKAKGDEDAVVLVAVGGLHSTMYIFDALTGCRVKVLSMQNQKEPQDSSTTVEARPPLKRTRCSYLSLREDHSSENSLWDWKRKKSSTGTAKHSDSESSYISSDSTSPRSGSQDESPRQVLLHGLVKTYGMNAVFRAGVTMLRVVPLPFSPFCNPLQEDNTYRPRKTSLVNGPLYPSPGVAHSSGKDISLSRRFYSSSDAATVSALSSSLLPCSTFLGQLRLATKEENSSNGSSSPTHCQAADAQATASSLCHDVPFASVSHEEFCCTVSLGDGSMGNPKTVATSAMKKGDSGAPPKSASHRRSSHLRCGVVNSVALWYDKLKGGVYVFSSDEFGRLFISGGLLCPPERNGGEGGD